MEIAANWLSTVPVLVAIGLAFLTRRVLPALFAAVLSGGVVCAFQTNNVNDINIVQRFLLPALGSTAYAKILVVYLWSLGGLIGMWQKTGGAEHFARTVGALVAKGRTSARLFAWLVGVIFHQGGTISTVLAGTTVKPVTDDHGVAHEELAYIVDSTASPVATVLPFNAWPAYIAGLTIATLPFLQTETDAFSLFFSSIVFNFYGIIALVMTLLFALDKLPWIGARMGAARQRAVETGQLDGPDARPLLPPAESDNRDHSYTPSLLDFFVPISVLLTVAIGPIVLFDKSYIDEAFVACVLSSMLLASLRGMRLNSVLDGFITGCKSMTIGAIMLGLAVTLAAVTKELQTAQYLVSLVDGIIPMLALPAFLTAVCMAIAFACGSSWGTYAVVFPVALPLAYALSSDVTYIQICFGAVLGGAVFGDQCSPISDTTILSSMFTGCDLMDHVGTQLPLALTAATLAAIASTMSVLLLV